MDNYIKWLRANGFTDCVASRKEYNRMHKIKVKEVVELWEKS